jgi:hypothetical protein
MRGTKGKLIASFQVCLQTLASMQLCRTLSKILEKDGSVVFKYVYITLALKTGIILAILSLSARINGSDMS